MCRVVEMTDYLCNLIRRRSLLVVLYLIPVMSAAHSPHHLITDIATAPTGAAESHTYILITDQIFRSRDAGGPWKNLVNGINNQYSFTSVKLSPDYAVDKTAFVASSGDGIYRTTDHGEVWEKISVGLGKLDIHLLSVSSDFATDGRLLAAAGSGGVWRSVDGGDHWQMVLTEGAVITSFDEGRASHEQGVVIAGGTEGKVWRSEDNGRLWEVVIELPESGAATSVATLADVIYVGTEKGGLYRSDDSGRSFTQALLPGALERPICQLDRSEQAVPDAHISSVTIVADTVDAHKVLVTSWYGGVYVSEDSGHNWTVWQEGLSCDSQADRLSVPHFRNIAITQLEDGKPTYWLGAFDGLFRSDGESSHWQQQETLPLGQIKGMAVTASEHQPLVIALSTYGGGFYLTEDAGMHWTIGNKGLQTTRLTGMAFSPDYRDDAVIYAGAIRRLLKSEDRGQSWQLIRLDIPSFGTRVVNKLRSWGVPTAWLDSSDSRSSTPVYPTDIVVLSEKRGRRVLIGTRYHGVMAFNEADASIESIWPGTDHIISSLELSPGFERDQTLFASVRGEGLFRSDDGGATWAAGNRGLDFVSDWALNADRGDFRRDMALAVSPGFSTDKTLFVGSPAGDGLYMSADRGNSWAKSSADFGASPAPVLAVAVSPEFSTDDSLLVSIKGGGLFLSNDRGKHFAAVGLQLIEENASIEHLEYSPNYGDDQLLVAASDEKLFLSVDKGKSWSEVPRPVRYEDMRDVVDFDRNWEQLRGESYSASTETVSSEQGSSTAMRFIGDGVRWLGSKGPGYGSARVFIDGELVASVSCRSDRLRHMQEIFSVQGLGLGPHKIEVRVHAEPGQDAGTIAIDAFDVLP